MGSTLLAEIKTGADLVSSVWGAVGLVIVFGAVVVIFLTCFVGQNKNIKAGVGALIGVALMAFLASSPDKVVSIGQTVGNILGL